MRVLVISTHPDDETAGCGGTLLAHQTHGAELFWLIITKAQEPMWSKEMIRAKEAEVERVASAYGMKDYFWSGLPSTMLDKLAINDTIACIVPVLERIRPQIVYTVHHGDVHTDHIVVFQAVTIVLKPFHMRNYGVGRLLTFETLSSTDAAPNLPARAFTPNVYYDVTAHIENKLSIMALYATEAQPDPFPRGMSALRALARFRGASIGVEYAEAFMLIREVN